MVTGAPWTGWYRREVSAEQYIRLERLLRERYAESLKGYPSPDNQIENWSLGELQDIIGVYVSPDKWL